MVSPELRHTFHKQVELNIRGRRILCDQRIAHVIRGLNEIPGVSTTTSCWDAADFRQGGYVVVRNPDGRFINYLKSNERGFSVVDDPKRKLVHIDINPSYEGELSADEKAIFIDEAWNTFLGVALKYGNGN